MRNLTKSEIKETSGGIWPVLVVAGRILLPTIINMGVYAFNRHRNDNEITPQGLAIAAGTGIVTGGIGAAAGAAGGSTILANAVWTPGTMGLNVSGNLIAKEH